MGFWRSIFGPAGYEPPAAIGGVPPHARARFAVDVDSGVLYGTPTLDDYIRQTGRITRAEAMRVPAVKRARDLICGEIGQFPLKMYGPDGKPIAWSLLEQPEAGVAPSVTITRTVEDLLLHERAWWRTVHVGWHGRPADVQRLDAPTVTIQPTIVQTPHGSSTVWPDVPGLIRLDSPSDGLLTSSPAIRACIALDRATLNAVNGVPPMDYFTPAEGVDPFEDDDAAADYLDTWTEARRTRTTAYVPYGLKYNEAGWDPTKLQLVEAREFAITEVARLTGIDAEELSVSTTSRTYANMQDRRRHRLESVLGPFMTAIEGRLSLDDVTPHGFRVAFDTSSYLRLDDLSAAQSDAVLITARVLTPDEARAKRSLEPLGEQAPADPAAVNAALTAVAAIETARAQQRPTTGATP